jgi:hypothetical protein
MRSDIWFSPRQISHLSIRYRAGALVRNRRGRVWDGYLQLTSSSVEGRHIANGTQATRS